MTHEHVTRKLIFHGDHQVHTQNENYQNIDLNNSLNYGSTTCRHKFY
jgi:hypothetical protein